jgi:pyruvate,water dikinase
MAVVVQRMIPAKKSGITFTVNPVGQRQEILIEAVFGLGEPLVSGRVQPDSYWIDRRTLQLMDKKIGSKNILLTVTDSGSLREIRASSSQSSQPALNDKELKSLARTALKVEQSFGSPQDIEWSISDKIYVLQARPITTLRNTKRPRR